MITLHFTCLFEDAAFLVCVGIYHIRVYSSLFLARNGRSNQVQRNRALLIVEQIATMLYL